jgi:fucose 4-O-acetylase-like acetyltransferase
MAENVRAATSRLAAVDVGKLAAAAAVVWIHVTACEQSRALLPLCRFAVPFFTAAAVYFVLQKACSSSNASFTAYTLQRARRLYVPFLIWGLFYLAVRLVKQLVTGSGSPIVWSPALLLNGTTHHLWFLPFVCVASIAVFGLVRWRGLPPGRDYKWWSLALALLGAALSLTNCPVIIDVTNYPITYFIDHAWDALPSVLLGAALFLALRTAVPSPRARWSALAIGLGCIVAELWSSDLPVAPHLAGAAFLLFCLTQPDRPWMMAVQPWAELAFVIYLIHVLFVEGLQTVADRFGSVTSLPADLSVWALSLVASAIVARLLLRSNALAWASPR